jgi:hypothetical protein
MWMASDFIAHLATLDATSIGFEARGEATDRPRFAMSGEVSDWGAVVSIGMRGEADHALALLWPM